MSGEHDRRKKFKCRLCHRWWPIIERHFTFVPTKQPHRYYRLDPICEGCAGKISGWPEPDEFFDLAVGNSGR